MAIAITNTTTKFTRVATELLRELPERARTVVERRFGIGNAKTRTTLEAVGKTMGITRERVRQIEAAALKRIRESAEFEKAQSAFEALHGFLDARGGVVAEKTLFDAFALAGEQHAVHFLLALNERTHRLKEDDDFTHRWTNSPERAREIEEALRSLHQELGAEEEPLTKDELQVRLARHCKQGARNNISAHTPVWLLLSRRIGQNALGEWGLVTSPQIHPRGVRDLSYVVMKRHGSPMHFTEVAAAVKKQLGREAHIQTVHNELIKDNRFVLVGRGLYALKEWGYQQGTVRDIIKNILREIGRPIAKPELLKRILKERHVKESTILINLQNKRDFRRLSDGSYTLV